MPSIGTRKWYQKWWLWAGVGAAGVGVAILAGGGGDGDGYALPSLTMRVRSPSCGADQSGFFFALP
jgi:hypothetical protein